MCWIAYHTSLVELTRASAGLGRRTDGSRKSQIGLRRQISYGGHANGTCARGSRIGVRLPSLLLPLIRAAMPAISHVGGMHTIGIEHDLASMMVREDA